MPIDWTLFEVWGAIWIIFTAVGMGFKSGTVVIMASLGGISLGIYAFISGDASFEQNSLGFLVTGLSALFLLVGALAVADGDF